MSPVPDLQSPPASTSTAASAVQQESATESRWRRWGRRWSQLVAIGLVLNLGLVLFHLSYSPLRETYRQYVPALVALYDPVKGIVPNPRTQHYLQTVDRLEQARSQQNTSALPDLLADLRQQSIELIVDSPFSSINQPSTEAAFKQRMQSHMGTPSAIAAFQTFWDASYLDQTGWTAELQFFEAQIRPILQQTYWRTVGENGALTDRFNQLDLGFLVLFIVDFLGRTWRYSRNQPSMNWGDAILRRWYDWPLLLPMWRWLRVMPTVVRLHQSGLVNLERMLAQLTHEPAAYLAHRVSTFLTVRLINQTQASIRQGDAAKLLFQPKDYIQVSNVNKVDAIADRLIQLIIYQVLPTVQPDLEVLLHHSLSTALKQSDVYESLQQIPGLGNLPDEATEQLSAYLAQATYEVLAHSYADLEGRALMERLSQDFKQALKVQLQNAATQQELQTLLSDLLEELKLNYIQRSVQLDPKQTMAEVDELERVVGEAAILPPATPDTPTAAAFNDGADDRPLA